MAGLLDALFSGGSGGGLLDFLRNNAMNQQFNSGPASDQAQYGQPQSSFAQMQSSPMMQPSIPQNPPPVIQSGAPVQPMAQAPAPQPALQPDFGQSTGGLGAGVSGFVSNLHTGPIGALIGGIGSAMGMQDPATKLATQQRSAMFQALRASGFDQQTSMAAALNPEVGNKLLEQRAGQTPHTQEIDKDGNVWDVNSLTGQKTIALQQKDDKYQLVKTADGMGVERPVGAFNTKDATFKRFDGSQGSLTGDSGLGDMNKSGPEYLATLPKAQAGVVQGMIDGTIQPPSSFALAKPYWQGMLAAAKNVDPTFDANNWATRHKLSTDMASSGNSSMGGILSNGKSAFAHLSDLSGSMADLGNASHDYPGGGTVAAVQNYLGNKALAGSDTRAKIKAISDNLGHYGQESTKFYSGTGGGVEERMNALKEMNPETTSSEEMASYLAKEKSLMTDRLKQKEAQIRDTMGEGYLAKHPVFTPDLQQTLDTIDGNIAKLNGSKPAVQPPSGEGAIAHNPKTGETIIRKNGKWVPYS